MQLNSIPYLLLSTWAGAQCPVSSPELVINAAPAASTDCSPVCFAIALHPQPKVPPHLGKPSQTRMIQVPDFNPATMTLSKAGYPSLYVAVRCTHVKVAKDPADAASRDVACGVEYVIGVNYTDVQNPALLRVPVIVMPLSGQLEIPACTHAFTTSVYRGCDPTTTTGLYVVCGTPWIPTRCPPLTCTLARGL